MTRLDTPLARRALRLPAKKPLQQAFPARAVLQLLLAVSTIAWWRRITIRLREIGTPQARREVFQSYARSWWINAPSYGEGLDFILRHFQLANSLAPLNDVASLGLRSVRNAWLLGLRDVEALKAFKDEWGRIPAEKLAVFIELGAIRSVDELAWLEPWRDQWDEGENNRAGSASARRSMKRLLELGVPRKSVTKLLSCWGRSGAEELNRSLATLAARGYTDSARLFEALGETLWRVRRAHNLDFVIDVIGAREIQEIALFDRLLDADTLPNAQIVHMLRARDATSEDLAHLQSFLLTAADRCEVPGVVVDLLLAEPHALRIRQLAHCQGYVSQRNADDLRTFLANLAHYGFGTADAVIAFQSVYRSWLTLPNIGRLLALHCGFRDAHAEPTAAAAWISDVGEKQIDSLEYLVQALRITDRLAFNEIRPLARIVRSVLVWAVEERRLDTREALCHWHRRSRGLEQVKAYESRDPVFLLVLEDALAREDFGHVNRNMGAFWQAQTSECNAVLGRAPIEAGEASVREYWAQRRMLEEELCQRVIPALRHQLQATGGLLAKSLIRAAWRDAHSYAQELDIFNRDVAALLDGYGPDSADISELQADAISAVFGIDLQRDDARWTQVVGYERHVEPLGSRLYSMRFAQQHVELKRSIDYKGLGAFVAAIHYGQRFRDAIGVDVNSAWHKLSPKPMRLAGTAASMETLHRHLGVLLGALPFAKCEAFAVEVEALGLETHEPAQRRQAVRRLIDWFDVQLGDALPHAAEMLEAEIGEVESARLARRLVDEPASGGELESPLAVALTQTAARVREVYGRWLYRERGKFSGTAEFDDSREYRAVVSKHGAAYFAKVGADLCSADNVAMWREARHSHLLVFDVAGRRLVAMAMLYVQRISAIDAKLPTLIMRAVNTLANEEPEHDVASIVEAFLTVGRHLAEDNHLAAFAVPDNTGQHLLSNRNDIAAGILERCRQRQPPCSSSYDSHSPERVVPYSVRPSAGEGFYGYEHGRAPVDTLHVLWAAPLPPALASSGNALEGVDGPVVRPNATRAFGV